MAKKTTKKPSPPAEDPKEKVVYLRISPEDYEIVEEMKKQFYQATVNQAVIRGLHDWQKLILENKDLKDALRSARQHNETYLELIADTVEGLMANQKLIETYNQIKKG
jgi:uncharacterized protein YigA (DUF484 family)